MKNIKVPKKELKKILKEYKYQSRNTKIDPYVNFIYASMRKWLDKYDNL